MRLVIFSREVRSFFVCCVRFFSFPVRNYYQMRHTFALGVLLGTACLVSLHPVQKHDYGKLLRLSLLFYETQRSGPLPQDNRISWRGDSAVNDSGSNGEDLSGGYYDGTTSLKQLRLY